MKILRIRFHGFNTQENVFSDCFILIREDEFSIPRIFEIAKGEFFSICSELQIDRLIEKLCIEEGGDFLIKYRNAEENEFSFSSFPYPAINSPFVYKLPRFSEDDFKDIINELGGIKIPESDIEMPDFLLNDIALELKDIQTESLYNEDRQNTIGKFFETALDSTINLDAAVNYGYPTEQYYELIKKSINNNHIRKADKQIISFKKSNHISSAGIILLNTGMFTLPHDLLQKMIEDLIKKTKSIEFALIFSQIAHTNGFDTYVVFGVNFVGKVPENVEFIRVKINEEVNRRMSIMMTNGGNRQTAKYQQPISFLSSNKIFYWSPGRIKLPWE
jgi:hypothetical protein